MEATYRIVSNRDRDVYEPSKPDGLRNYVTCTECRKYVPRATAYGMTSIYCTRPFCKACWLARQHRIKMHALRVKKGMEEERKNNDAAKRAAASKRRRR